MPQLLTHIAKGAKRQVDRPQCIAMLRSLVALQAKNNVYAPAGPCLLLELCGLPGVLCLEHMLAGGLRLQRCSMRCARVED